MRSLISFYIFLLATMVFATCVPAGIASAYVGPGPGLTVLGALWAVIAAVLLAVLAIVRWPIRYLIRKLRGGKPPEEDSGPEVFADRKTEVEDPKNEG